MTMIQKKHVQELVEREESFRTLFENSTVGIYRTTPDGRILLANPALVRMLGYASFEDLSNLNLSENEFGPEYSRAYFIQKIRTEIVIQGMEAAWKKKDGSTIYVRESARAVFDRDGGVKYYEGTVEDVTDRKKAELELQASERKFRRIFDNSLEGIFEMTGDGRILVANKAMARIFGYGSIGEFKAVDFSLHFADQNDLKKIKDILAVEHEIHNRELYLRRKDETVFHALLNATVLLDADGRVDSIEGMLADISGLAEPKAAPQGPIQEKDD